MHASARGVTVEVDDPVTRKQRSLYRASLCMPEGERFTDLYGILKWRPWIERAARAVLGDGPGLRYVDGVVGRVLAAVARAREEEDPVGGTGSGALEWGFDDIHWCVLEEALCMVLEPLYAGAAARSPVLWAGPPELWDMPGRLRRAWRVRNIAKEIRASFEAGPWASCEWVIQGGLGGWASGAARKSVIRALKSRVKDRRFIEVLTGVLKTRGAAWRGDCLGVASPVSVAGEGLHALLAGILLSIFEEWLGKMSRYYPARSFHYGGFLMLLVPGTRDELEAVVTQAREYLVSELGLSPEKVVLDIVPREPELEFLGFCFRRRGGRNGVGFTVYPGKSAISYYKSRVRRLTSLKGSPLKDLGEVITAINELIEEWRVCFGAASSRRTFSYLDSWTRRKVFALLCKRHPGIPRGTVFRRSCSRQGIIVEGHRGPVLLDRLVHRRASSGC
ncbi:MAG: hypothetical protein HPY71_06315 [Firmicutes bacterium]|nr:hypothetical protein [Bacillota bacterium]